MKDSSQTKGQTISRVDTMPWGSAGREGLAEHRRAEELFRILSHSSPVGIYIIQDGRFQYVNPQFQQYLGRSEEELLNTTPLSLVFPDDRQMVRENAIRMLRGESSSPYEYRTVTRTGEMRWIMESVVSIQYRDRRATLGNYLDVTEHKQMEGALRESERRYRLLAENAADIIWSVDLNMRPTFMSPSVKRLLGYSVEEAMAKAMSEVFTPDSYRLAMEVFAEEMAVEEMAQKDLSRSRVLELEMYRKDGPTAPMEVKYSFLRGPDDHPVGILAIGRDITERKRMEEALRREKERAELYLNIAEVMLATLDADGRISLINKKGCKILGYQEGELIGKSWCDTLVPPKIRGEIKGVFNGLMRGDTEPFEYYENPLLTKDGEERLMVFHNTVIRDQGGRVVGVLLSAEDVTELRKAQAQLQHSQLLASLGEMTAGIAHEVNNPLGSILLYSELLMMSDVSPQIRKDLKVIHDEAKRAARVMTDLLTYGRRVSPRMRCLNLHRIIKKVVDMRRYEERVHNITTSLDLLSGPLYVMGESSQLMQVFMNLVLNAEESLNKSNGGTIAISTQIRGKWARVLVADSGTGIPQESLNQIFYPFFTTKRVGEGTGLGLSTCYGIVTAHKGLIRAENNEMGGATFIVEMPLAQTGRKVRKQPAACR